MNKIIRCTCGKLYKFFEMYCGDQSVCQSCREELRKELETQINVTTRS